MLKWIFDETGVTSTEYAVLLAVLLGTCTSAINCLGRMSQLPYYAVAESLSGESELPEDLPE